jgi:hypothetical protein
MPSSHPLITDPAKECSELNTSSFGVSLQHIHANLRLIWASGVTDGRQSQCATAISILTDPNQEGQWLVTGARVIKYATILAK